MRIKGLKNRLFSRLFLGTFICLFFLSFYSSPGFSEDNGKIQLEVSIPVHIAEAQWSTVEKLQKLLDEKNYQKALLCFSEKVQERIKILQNEDSNYPVYFFEQWTLNEESKKKYKETVFKGKGSFIYDVDEQEWKINEATII